MVLDESWPISVNRRGELVFLRCGTGELGRRPDREIELSGPQTRSAIIYLKSVLTKSSQAFPHLFDRPRIDQWM
jgi:hypothetical protein